MHPESLQLMVEALDGVKLENALVLDVGSLDVNGTYRPTVESRGWEYVGLDIKPGWNVDVVTPHPYEYPFDDEAFDVVVSGNTMEHVEAIWVWIVELQRVLKEGGFLAICTLMCWGEHRYPVDCWRVLPDGMTYLLGWAGFEGCQTRTIGHTILGSARKKIIGRDNMAEEKEIAEVKKKGKKPLPELTLTDGMIVGAAGMGIWVIEGGKRRSVVDVRNQIAMGIGMHHVIMLHPEQLEAVPEGEPMPRRR